MLLPVLQSSRPELAGLVFAVLGFGAVALGRDPNGLANLLFGVGRRLDRQFGDALRRAVPVLPLPRDRADDGAETDIPLKEDLQEVGFHAAARG
jgi:branched-chain amino acid transport system permease protein